MLYDDIEKNIDGDIEPYVNLDNGHYGFYSPYGWVECGLIKNVEIINYGKYTVLFGQNGAKEWCYAITDVKKGEGDFIGEGSGYKKNLVFDDLILDMEDLGVRINESRKSSRKSLRESISSRDLNALIGIMFAEEETGLQSKKLNLMIKYVNHIPQLMDKKGEIFAMGSDMIIDYIKNSKENFEIVSLEYIESRKSSRKSLRESYEYEDIKNEIPIIDVWGNSEGTHVYEVFKINSDYVYYEYNYRKHDSIMITDVNEIEVIIRLMDYLPTKFIVKQEDKIGMLESAIANIKAINKHYGKLKKYNSNYYWQAVRFIKNSMLKDDNPDASNYFDEADDVINDALEQNGDSFRV